MISAARWLWLALPVVALALVLWAGGVAVLSPTLGYVQRPCTSSPQFRVGYAADPAGLREQDGVWSFRGESWLQTEVCGPGVLTLNARGEAARGEGPQIIVSLNGRSLLDARVTTQQRLSVPIPEAGTLTLAYTNDVNDRDVRVATLRDVNLGDGCPAPAQATLIDAPLILTPCAAGMLAFRLSGRAGKGAQPVVRVSQKGQVLLTQTALAEAQKIEVSVTDSPVTLTISNPYNRLIADRNLFMSGLEFRPTQTP